MSTREPFERAFVAVTCLLGRKEGAASGLLRPSPTAVALESELLVGDRGERARLIAARLAPVAAALEARRLA